MAVSNLWLFWLWLANCATSAWSYMYDLYCLLFCLCWNMYKQTLILFIKLLLIWFLIGLFIFTPGLVIVLRARSFELTIFCVTLILPMVGIATLLTWQLVNTDDLLDWSDMFLMVMLALFGVIILNLILYIRTMQVLKQSRRTNYEEVNL